jgi:DNA polymerase-3 subunit delta
MTTVYHLLKSLKTEELKPVYLLLGKEKFFHDQVINEMTQRLFSDASSRSLNRIILHGTENTLPDVLSASLSYPMLSRNKLVVVKEFNQIKSNDSESFLNYLNKPQKSTILVLSCEEAGKTKLFLTLKELAEVVDCKPVSEFKIAEWIKDRIILRNLKISEPAITMMIEYTGNNLLTIEHELDKIVDFKNDQTEITEADVIAVSGMSKEHNVFTFQKALIQKNFNRSYIIGKNLIDAGENINLIISIIFSFFRKALAFIKNPNSPFASKLGDFQKREINQVFKKFNIEGLEKVVQVLNNFDKQLKTTTISPSAIIQNICYNICKK